MCTYNLNPGSKVKRYLIILFVFLLSSHSLFGQNNIGLKFFGVTIHPKAEENAFLMPRKFDRNGILVLNLGAMMSYELFIYDDSFSLKGVQGLYSDCAARLGGFSHIGVRGKLFKTERHSLYGGIGPTIIYRRNWSELPGYRNINRFKGNEGDRFQYLFVWYGGEFEYAYKLNNRIDLTATFIPGYPDLMSLSFGVKYKWQKQDQSI